MALNYRWRLTLYVSALALLPLLLLALVAGLRFQSALTREVNGSLRIEAEGIEQLVEASMAEREAGVRSWSEDAIIRGALIYSSFEKSDGVLAVLQKRYPVFRAIVLFTPDGQVVSASDADSRRRYAQHPAKDRAWFQAALTDQPTSESLDRADEALGARVLHLAMPVLSPADGKVIGVLSAAYDWSNLADKVRPALVRAQAREHTTFEIVVARPDGRVLFDSAPAPRARIAELEATVAGNVSGELELSDKVGAFAVNQADRRDIGDGWVFMALLSRGEAYREIRAVLYLTVGLLAAFAVLAVAGSLLMSRQLVRPINELNRVVSRIVKEGDLTQRIVIERKDEIGQLAESFTQMVAKLREIPTSLQESALLLTEAVQRLTTSTQEQSQTVSKQAAALQETHVTAQEIKQTSSLAAQKTEAVLKVTERAEEIGRQGEAAIEQSLGGLSDIRARVEEIAQKIAQLSERTAQIGGITQTVKDLADQSNMLALNAAIEAVRSGEHGKGFAVVAREIRSLADQSIQATNRVREILDDISGAIRGAVSITEQGKQRMEAGLVQMKSSGENLRELSSIVKDSSQAMRQIAAAVNQQNAGVSQIFTAVTELSKMMDDTVSRLDTTNKAAGTLKDVTDRVSTIVKSYRV